MKIETLVNGIKAIKETGDKIYTESALFHKIKTALNESGSDLIKKAPCKDGHIIRLLAPNLMDAPYYLRDRKWRYCLLDNLSALRNLAKDFNQDGSIELIRNDFVVFRYKGATIN